MFEDEFVSGDFRRGNKTMRTKGLESFTVKASFSRTTGFVDIRQSRRRVRSGLRSSGRGFFPEKQMVAISPCRESLFNNVS